LIKQCLSHQDRNKFPKPKKCQTFKELAITLLDQQKWLTCRDILNPPEEQASLEMASEKLFAKVNELEQLI
jgi:hypothetical protein